MWEFRRGCGLYLNEGRVLIKRGVFRVFEYLEELSWNSIFDSVIEVVWNSNQTILKISRSFVVVVACI